MPRAVFLKVAIVKKKKKKYAQDLWLRVLNVAVAPLPKNGAIAQKNAASLSVYGPAYKTGPLFSRLSRVFKKRSFNPSGAAFLQMRPKKTRPQTPTFCSVVPLGRITFYTKSPVFLKKKKKINFFKLEKPNRLEQYEEYLVAHLPPRQVNWAT